MIDSISSHSRRSILKRTVATAGALCFARSAFAFEGATDQYGGLNVAIQTSSLRAMSFDDALTSIRDDLKLDRAEICPQHLDGLSAVQVTQKLKAAGIKPLSYGCGPFTKSHDDNRKAFEYAKAIGFTNISADPDPDALDSLDKLTDEYKITVAIRDRGPTYRWSMIDDMASALKNHSRMIGLCNDTGQFIRAGEDPVRACEVFKDRMYAVHLKDFTLIKLNYEPCVVGQGSLDLLPLMMCLMRNKYSGGVFLEYDGDEPVQKLQASLERLTDAAKKIRNLAKT